MHGPMNVKFIYMLVSLTNITMTKDSITDYLLSGEGSYCKVHLDIFSHCL